MNRQEKEYLDSLKYNAEKAEEALKKALPEKVDRLLSSFIAAKEDYVEYRNKMGQ